ncbi:GNAT family N-acetyltransferase [Paucibacter sp. B2R-40]|uniref:GNAT family N-acetyltransferase n=1 Tax=Paucibacter sp. B2R-40 TaxID=2893554 RepID=UPI0021E4897B|nr:GNAT family N-acetyltransferase [Paucibacter sp. B2R-40]MCV2356866.1 GNAT family N-acetyltransferase [Paucibacter sp. B2R-40]
MPSLSLSPPLAPPAPLAPLASSASAASSPLSSWVDPQGRYLQLRPQGAGDAELLGALWNNGLSEAARFNRFLGQSRSLSEPQVAEQVALSAGVGQGWLITERLPGQERERALAEGRWTPAASRREGLLALCVRTRCQGQGLGRHLLQALLRGAQQQGLHGLSLHALEANADARQLASKLGFECAAAAPGSPWLRLHYRFRAQPQRMRWPRWHSVTPAGLQFDAEDFHV